MIPVLQIFLVMGSRMTVSSRTPEGMPSRCALCGAETNIDFSDPVAVGQVDADATCPKCGHLLWASAAMVYSIVKKVEDTLGFGHGKIDADTKIRDVLGADSLDTVELIMALEDEYAEFSVTISDDVAEGLESIGDVVRYLERMRRTQKE